MSILPLYQRPGDRYLNWLLVAMLGIALFLNLGRNSVMMEEARRAQIALEMKINGDQIVPTYFGELYYKKPPMFNWVVEGSFWVFGETEFALRLVSVLSLLVMMAGHYLIARRHASEESAFYSALFIGLGPTMLFWLSILGEIDLFYSCITYLSILGFYHLISRERKLAAFVLIYGLGAVGLLTKGLPSPVFIAATVGGYAIYRKAWPTFFSWRHLAGIAVFALIAGAYFYAYSRSYSLEDYFSTLLNESGGRTAASQGGNLPLHLVTFPLKIMVDMLPVALFGLLLLKRDIREDLLRDPLNRFCLFIYGFNILPYFLSPGTKMSYIVMLHPLLLLVLTRVYLRWEEESDGGIKKVIRKMVFPVMIGLLGLGMLAALFVPDMQQVGGLYPLVVVGLIGVLGLALAYWKWEGRILQWLVILMLAGRIGFDLLVLPARDVTGMHTRLRHHGLRISEIVADRPLHLWGEHNESTFSHMMGFYLMRERKEILSRSSEKNCGDFYIALRQEVNPDSVEIYYTLNNPPHFLHLFRFPDCP